MDFGKSVKTGSRASRQYGVYQRIARQFLPMYKDYINTINPVKIAVLYFLSSSKVICAVISFPKQLAFIGQNELSLCFGHINVHIKKVA